MSNPDSSPGIEALYPVKIFASTSSGHTITATGIYSEVEGLLRDLQVPRGEVITAHWIRFPSGRRADLCPSCHQFALQRVLVHDPETGESTEEIICSNHPKCGGPLV